MLSADEFGQIGAQLSTLAGFGLHFQPAILFSTDPEKELDLELEMEKILPLIRTLREKSTKSIKGQEIFFLDFVLSPAMAFKEEIRIGHLGFNLQNFDLLAKHFLFSDTLRIFRRLLTHFFCLKYFNEFKLEVYPDPDDFFENKLPVLASVLSADEVEVMTFVLRSKSPEDLKNYLVRAAQGKQPWVEQLFGTTLGQVKLFLNGASHFLKAGGTGDALALQSSAIPFWDSQSGAGWFETHDLASGEPNLHGTYKNGNLLRELDAGLMGELEMDAERIRESSPSIERLSFTVESGRIFFTAIREAENFAPQADLAHKLSLIKRGRYDEKALIKSLSFSGIEALLHPIVDKKSAEGLKMLVGGIHGSYGAATGKVYFSAESLLAAHEKAALSGEKTDFILAMPGTYSGEVKAIKLANGVLSSEGGYSSHAPVVARSMNKVAMVNNQISFSEKSFTLSGATVNEGDEITLSVELGQEPVIYLGRVPLTHPDFEKNHLYEVLDLLDRHNTRLKIYSNVDQPAEAKVAASFRAAGVGLCRTEHMFFHEGRLQSFVEMILGMDAGASEGKILSEIEAFQKADFIELLKIFDGKPVTIRLLDAPLHEFLPQNEADMDKLVGHFRTRGSTLSREEIVSRCAMFHEFNPMLGHRGCRLGITRPEIYHMQVRAIMRAACELHAQSISVKPRIMVPIIMHPNEMKFIRNGKVIEGKSIPGIIDTVEGVLREHGLSDVINYQIGSMIEIPSAALYAGELAKHCDFFSFGTNDLTQTTLGLSR
ncbi:MAG: hypothetical protein JNM63_09070, partial [Spirochaetia bacterium]|nr:hypothetical protein [Spirochaetia bacterium]